MRFIKRFRLFESAERETLNDILLDLSDTGGYSITNKTYFVKEVFPNSRNITTIRHAEIGKEFKWNSISDTILRLIDYLGDDFIFISLSTKEMLNLPMLYIEKHKKIKEISEFQEVIKSVDLYDICNYIVSLDFGIII